MKTAKNNPEELRTDLKILLLVVLYFGSAWIGFQLSFDNPLNIPVWYAAGTALALLIIMGKNAWPGIAIGSLLTQLYAYWNFPGISSEQIIFFTILIAGGATLQALAGNFLFGRMINATARNPFTRSKDAFSFLFVSVAISGISATFYSAAMLVTTITPFETTLQTWISWWIGNTVGILLITPIVLAWRGGISVSINRDKILEILLLIACVAGVAALYRIENLSGTMERAFPFLVIPFLLWLAFRFKLAVALSIMGVVALFGIFRTTEGIGPLFLPEIFGSTILIQAFVGVISVSTLIVAATVTERNSIQRELESFNETLESQVTRRTRALNKEIEERKVAENKLRLSNRNLRKTNSELDNFVYSVSHDLRAPISSILGLINLSKADKTEGMNAEYLEMIERSIKHQDRFIKTILDQMRNARMEVKKEQIRFDKLVDEAFESLKYIDIAAAIKRKINIHQEKPFYSDPWRLKVILNNLIANSIRYKNGKPTVINVDIESDEKQAHIHIQDNGRGIARKHLRHVFKMFYRATDQNAGAGLGLYVVKETLDKLNGEIKLSSTEGHGTIVDLTIPSLN